MNYNLICIFICTPVCANLSILVKSGCHIAPVVSRGGHLVERTPKQKLDHRPPGRMQVPQVSSTHDKIVQRNPVIGHEETEPAT
jgi:hypothetical protein